MLIRSLENTLSLLVAHSTKIIRCQKWRSLSCHESNLHVKSIIETCQENTHRDMMLLDSVRINRVEFTMNLPMLFAQC